MLRVGIQKALHVGKPKKPKSIASKPMSSKPQHKVSVTMAVHHVDDNPHGIHAAQLNDARRALASSQPYNPRAKKKSKKLPRAGTTFKTPIHAKAQKYYG